MKCFRAAHNQRCKTALTGRFYDLFRAGLLHRPQRGRFVIRSRATGIKSTGFVSFSKWISHSGEPVSTIPGRVDTKNREQLLLRRGPPRMKYRHSPTTSHPTSRWSRRHQSLNSSLSSDLLNKVGKMDPFRFEHYVVDLLFAMWATAAWQESCEGLPKVQ